MRKALESGKGEKGKMGTSYLEMKEWETTHFHIWYHESDSSLLAQIREDAENAYEKVSCDFGLQEIRAEKYEFYLCPDVESYLVFTNKTRESYQDWMVGWADYHLRRLCILSPRVVRDRSSADMRKVMVHEIVHIAMDSLGNAEEVELWIGEGIAVLYAGQTDLTYVSLTNFPMIENLLGQDNFYGNGGYDYAGIYVWYFIRKYGFAQFSLLYQGKALPGDFLYPGFEEEAVRSYVEAFG